MITLNQVFVAGNLTRDVTLRQTDGGTTVGDFGLAINETYSDKNGDNKDKVTFLDITVWRDQANRCADRISKGSNVLIEGKLEMDIWEDKQGNKRTKIKIVARYVHFNSPIDSKPDPQYRDMSTQVNNQVDDDAPF